MHIMISHTLQVSCLCPHVTYMGNEPEEVQNSCKSDTCHHAQDGAEMVITEQTDVSVTLTLCIFFPHPPLLTLWTLLCWRDEGNKWWIASTEDDNTAQRNKRAQPFCTELLSRCESLPSMFYWHSHLSKGQHKEHTRRKRCFLEEWKPVLHE